MRLKLWAYSQTAQNLHKLKFHKSLVDFRSSPYHELLNQVIVFYVIHLAVFGAIISLEYLFKALVFFRGILGPGAKNLLRKIKVSQGPQSLA